MNKVIKWIRRIVKTGVAALMCVSVILAVEHIKTMDLTEVEYNTLMILAILPVGLIYSRILTTEIIMPLLGVKESEK